MKIEKVDIRSETSVEEGVEQVATVSLGLTMVRHDFARTKLLKWAATPPNIARMVAFWYASHMDARFDERLHYAIHPEGEEFWLLWDKPAWEAKWYASREGK